MTLYRENFEAAIAQYDQVLKKKPDHSRAQYHQLIAKHLSTHRGQDLTELLAFESTQGQTDKFYNYWMGRVHMLRYDQIHTAACVHGPNRQILQLLDGPCTHAAV